MIVRELLRGGIEFAQTAAPGANPEIAGLVLTQSRDKVVADTGRRLFIVLFVDGKVMPVMLVQPVIGAKPHKTGLILENRVDRGLSKRLVVGELVKVNALVEIARGQRGGLSNSSQMNIGPL